VPRLRLAPGPRGKLWHAGPVPVDPDLLWKAYLRRFDQEDFHRFAKVYLGLASAHLCSAAATDRWVTLTMASYAQLRLARHLVDDLRRPWHPRSDPGHPRGSKNRPKSKRPPYRKSETTTNKHTE